MFTSSRLLVLAGICVAVLLVGTVVVLLGRTGHRPSPEARRTAGPHPDGTGPLAPPGAPTTAAGER